MALPQAKHDATEARLAGLSLPESGAWLKDSREDALTRLRATGIPSRRDEYWKFTNPANFVSPDAQKASVFEDGQDQAFGKVDQLKIVFVDGVFDADASDELNLEGIEIQRLAEAGSQDIHWAKGLYGTLEKAGQTPVERPLAAMNTAFATDGVLIHVTGKPAKPVSLVHIHKSDSSDAILHHVIRVDSGADLTLIASGPAAARFNECIEVDVADSGAFHHVRVQGRDHERSSATHMFARLGSESVFKSFTLTVNGVMTRNEAVIELNGDDATAHIAGACIGDGEFHHDDTVFITHDAVGCESRQVFKKVLRNGAEGVFQGKILVKEGAQKTDGYQISQSLLLDGDSSFQAKPELEIYADDVACSHGSTSGAIDEEAIFYLRSRGVTNEEAQDMLVLAFLAEALDEIEDERLADDLHTRLEAWFARRRG